MKLYEMFAKVAEWENAFMPNIVAYIDNHSTDGMDNLTQGFTTEQLELLIGGMGIFITLVHCYGLPSDLDELFLDEDNDGLGLSRSTDTI